MVHVTRSSPRRSRLVAWSLLLAAVAIVLTVIFGELPGEGRYNAVLQDSCHTPAFAALGILALLWLRSRATVATAIAVVVGLTLLGGATEVIQGLIGRDSELDDVVRDFVGASLAASLWLTFHWRAPRRYLTAVIALILFACWLIPLARCGLAYWQRHSDFPVLAQFQNSRDLFFVDSPSGRLEAGALCVSLTDGRWPGLTLTEPQPDWRGYHELLLDLTNTSGAPLHLRLRISDHAHTGAFEDRFNSELVLPPSTRSTLAVGLAEVAASPRGRRMDMGRIAQLMLFHAGPAPGAEVCVNRLWLR